MALGLLRDSQIRRAPVRVSTIARGLGIDVHYEPFDDDISGVLYGDGSGTVIGVNSLQHRNRQRFTIAHEIGHYLLHHLRTHIDKKYTIVLRNSRSSQAVDRSEIEANQFAAELLMPSPFLETDVYEYLADLEDETGLSELARLYRVSRQAMVLRLVNLGIIPSALA